MNEKLSYADVMMTEYKFFGERYSYHFPPNKPYAKIHDLSDDDIKAQQKELNRMNQYNEPIINCWITIFNDVLVKRRFNKLKKIKSNIQI